MIGRKFGRLTVLQYSHSDKHKMKHWLCRCDCGKEIVVRGDSLRSGNTRSCGCLHSDISKLTATIMNQKSRKYNKYQIFDEYVVGYTKENIPFVFDKKYFDTVKQYRWAINKDGYIRTVINRGKQGYHSYMLHRLITNCPPELVVDHINHDKTDNRIANLRICTRQENNRNRRIGINNTSDTTGVYFNEQSKKWVAYIMVDQEQKYLGIYENIEDAIEARKKAQAEIFQSFEYNPDDDVINSIPFAQYLLKEGVSNVRKNEEK